MIFEHLKGHEEVKSRLGAAITGDKVSHAYIFAGKRGVGKTTASLEFAKALTNGSDADIVVVTNSHYDTDTKSEAVSVKTVRSASADMYKKPYAADKRVFIIPEAEKMTPQAQNALLKVFEEPPSYCVIILITQNDNMLLQTIRSRAVTIRFGALADSYVEEYLQSKGVHKSSVLVRLAAGSIGMAADLCENEDLCDVLDTFVSMFKKIGSGKSADTYGLISYFQREKKNAEVLFDIMLIMLRDTMLKINSDLAIDGVSSPKAVRITEKVENTRNSFSYNANYDLAVSEMLLDILEEING